MRSNLKHVSDSSFERDIIALALHSILLCSGYPCSRAARLLLCSAAARHASYCFLLLPVVRTLYSQRPQSVLITHQGSVWPRFSSRWSKGAKDFPEMRYNTQVWQGGEGIGRHGCFTMDTQRECPGTCDGHDEPTFRWGRSVAFTAWGFARCTVVLCVSTS
jgi:hypothetical protein